MKYIFFDAETYYRQQDYSLKLMTPVEYLLDDRYELLGMAIAEGFDSQPFWLEPEEVPNYIKSNHSGVIWISHNMLFDGCILSYRLDYIPPMMACTMAITRAVAKQKLGRTGLLPSLALTANFLGLPPKGDFIHKMSGVNLATLRGNKEFHQSFREYGMHDVWLCREIFLTWCIRTNRFPVSEIPILDNVLRAAVVPQFQLDIPVLEAHLEKVKQHKLDLLVAAGVVDKAELMSNQKFAELLQRYGVDPPTKISPTTKKVTWAFSKQDLGFLALETHEDPDVQILFAARVGNKTTLEESRTERMITIGKLKWPNQSAQGWMPMPLRYSAARTHRLGGEWQLNVQNLPRGSDIRKALKAPEGCAIIAADASQIECRFTATLCGAWTLVNQFENGEDVYSSFATIVFNMPVSRATPNERFVGKQAVLGLGYGLGWVNFIRRLMIDSKNQIGKMIVLPDETGKHVVNLYRMTYKEIPEAWNLLGTQALYVLVNGGRWEWGPLVFEKNVIHLPNGMKLYYHDLQHDGEWTYDTGYEGRKKIYGPKILENIIQALARIATMEAGVRIRRRIKLPWALQSHDELVFVAPVEQAPFIKQVCLEEMRVRPDWLPRVPLTAECKIGGTYADAK